MRTASPAPPVTDLPPRVRRAVLGRSFLLQGSWNYETLVGTGFAFVLLPALRHLFRSDPAGFRQAVRRHSELFNSHPYLGTLAAGAVVRLESDGVEPEVIARFKNAVRGSLGSIGDQLVWLAWRPASALLAISLIVVGAPWWLAVAAFLLVYNSLHIWLRVWGLDLGLREGLGVGTTVREVSLGSWSNRAADAGALLAGVASVGIIFHAGPSPWGAGWAVVGIVAGLWLGVRVRRPAFAVVFLVWAAGLLSGITA
jgi:mannose PTS system EIID component